MISSLSHSHVYLYFFALFVEEGLISPGSLRSVGCIFPFPLYFLLLFFPQFSSVADWTVVRLFATPWIAAHQASLSITNSQSLLKCMRIKSVMPSNHLTLCRPLLLLPPIPPSIRVFSNASTLCMKWAKYWSITFSQLFIKPPQTTTLSSCISFSLGWFWLPPFV